MLSQASSASTSGFERPCRTARRSAGVLPLISRSVANNSSMRLDASYSFNRDRCLLQLGQLEELTATMRPAGGFGDHSWLAALDVEAVVASVGVGRHEAAVCGQMALGMRSTAISRVVQ